MKTISEQLFEEFCDDNGIEYERLEEGEEPSPDYLLTIPCTSVIVEVKEIERNKVEQESDKELKERGYGNVLKNEPGDRVRTKIRKASSQIKKRTKGKLPGLLVLYDEGNAHRHLDPYNIRVAMEGLEQINIAVPVNPQERPYSMGMTHGPKKKMTENANTSISAIAVMYKDEDSKTKIVIYHNKHAAVPLKLCKVDKYGIDHFCLQDDTDKGVSKWTKME
jgi:hypothetical protein